MLTIIECLKKYGGLLLLIALSFRAEALSFEPASPLVEVNGQIALSVQGAQGEVIWSANKGRVESNGNRATFFAPAEDGIATVVAIDGSGNVEKVRVMVAKGEEVAGGVSLDNAQWEVFTNTTDITALITSDDDSILWVGTTGGLEQRNANGGQLIRLFTTLDGLSANRISDLQTDGSNGLWVGTEGGLVHLKENHTLIEYKTDNTLLPSNGITSLYRDISGGIWVGTYKGLAYLASNKTWHVYNRSNSQLPSDNVRALYPDNQGGVWIGTFEYYDTATSSWTGGGLAHLSNNGIWAIYNSENSGLPGNYIFSLYLDYTGGLWVGTHYSGLAYKDKANQWTVYTQENSRIPDRSIRTIVADSNVIWLGMDEPSGAPMGGGLAFLYHPDYGNYWNIYKERHSPLLHNFVRALHIDKNKNLWVGTQKGLMYIKDSSQSPGLYENWITVNSFENGLPNNKINALYPDNNGGLWIGTGYNQDVGGLAHLSSASVWETYLTGTGGRKGTNEFITSLYANNNALWVGADFGLERQALDGTWSFFSGNTGQNFSPISTLLGNNEGELWVGTRFRGLFYLLPNDEWLNYNTDNSNLPSNDINALLYDRKGGLWIATNRQFDNDIQKYIGGGLVHKTSAGQWIIYDKTNSPLPTNEITSLYLDNQDNLWVGTIYSGEDDRSGSNPNFHAGLVKLSPQDIWQVFNTLNSGLPDDDIHNITDDGQGGLWIGTGTSDGYSGKGLAHFSSTGQWTVYKTDNSHLPNNSIFSLYKNVDNSLWVGTYNGLAHLSFPQPRLANLSGKRAVLLIHPEPIRGHNNHTVGEKISGEIYNALLDRYYRNDEIYFLAYKPDIDINQDYHADKNAVDAPVTFLQKSQGAVPRAITKDDIRQAFVWAQNQGTLNQPLLLIIIAHGMNDGSILLNPVTNETLSGAELAAMLNDYQQATQNQAIVILESAYSGTLLPALQGQKRVVISSTAAGQSTQYNPDFLGRDAFATKYFRALRRGGNFHSAFYEASRDYALTPQLDDDGDGVVASTDGRVAAGLCLNGCFTPKPSQSVYHNGDTIRVSLPPLPVDKDQYVALALPDGSVFVLSDFNALAALGTSLPQWQGGDVMFEVPVSADFPRGAYPLLLLRVPRGVEPMENPELWELNMGNLVIE